jgi:DNA polymerase I
MVNQAQRKIIVIDGSSYFFRAFYAIQRLSTSKGFPTNAIYGFINMLLRVLDVEKPTHLAIAFDTPKPSFRKELYTEYKANRESPPEDLIKQIPHILRAVDCFGIKRIELPGYEADDVIGTIAKRATKEGYFVDVITGDKDLMQLVDDQVTIYDSMKDKRYDSNGVKEKFGVLPHQVIDFLALMGDASDNIPGVTGVGEKTAAELINQFGSLDGIYENLETIKQEKRRETLRAEKTTAYLSQRLATVECDVPVKFSWAEFEYKGPKDQELSRFFEEMEFRGLMKRFNYEPSVSGEATASFSNKNYTTIATSSQLKKLVGELKKKKILAVDTETTSLTIQDAKLVGVSLCAKAGKSYYVPIGHVEKGQPETLVSGQMDSGEARELLKEILEDPKVFKIGQNLKYDLQVLKRFGIDVAGVVGDTLLESYLLDPDQPHNLDFLAERYLQHKNISYEEVTGKGKAQISFAEVSIDRATEYSCEDADVTLRLHEKFLPELKTKQVEKLYEEVEVPLVQILADMEFQGVLVDEKKLQKMSEALLEESAEVESKIYECAGETFNIASPKQLSHILFEKLKLPVIRRTKTGISTDEAVLTELKDKHKICALILKSRELLKLKSTYVDGLLHQIHPETRRVHTSYNQTVTATGRLSSSNPNLQNIPTGEGSGYDIRSVFVAPSGTELLSADYSQVELRLLADMSGEKELLRAFENDEDIHTYTGKLIFKTDKIGPEERRVAKTINFGVVYGQTPFGLSQTLKVSPGEAKKFIDAYFERYSGVKKYFQEVLQEARKNGFVSTKLGRRRYLSDLNSQNRMQREMAERAAINAPLQGSAADLIKIAMIRISSRLRESKLQSRMILQVHDELVFEAPAKEKSALESLVREEMEGAMKLKIPLKVDIGWGKNWRECK